MSFMAAVNAIAYRWKRRAGGGVPTPVLYRASLSPDPVAQSWIVDTPITFTLSTNRNMGVGLSSNGDAGLEFSDDGGATWTNAITPVANADSVMVRAATVGDSTIILTDVENSVVITQYAITATAAAAPRTFASQFGSQFA